MHASRQGRGPIDLSKLKGHECKPTSLVERGLYGSLSQLQDDAQAGCLTCSALSQGIRRCFPAAESSLEGQLGWRSRTGQMDSRWYEPRWYEYGMKTKPEEIKSLEFYTLPGMFCCLS